ncbi:hypothetical protein Ms3S1_00190 [Methylosinus sp. 3S-1]
MRYAKERLAGFSEVGKRGAECKYGEATDRRALALLDAPPPASYAFGVLELVVQLPSKEELCLFDRNGPQFATESPPNPRATHSRSRRSGRASRRVGIASRRS